jgi:predicted transcriptional regulator
VRHVIQIEIGVDYTDDLRKRMKEAGISQGMLAREMDLSASQVSRWFSKPIDPAWKTIQKIERAMLAIQKRLDKERVKAK